VIEFPRAVARRFRAVLRRSLLDGLRRDDWPPVAISAGAEGLTLRAVREDRGVRYRHEGTFANASIAFSAAALGEFEGAGGAVTLEELRGGDGQARWSEGGAPRTARLRALPPDRVPEFPQPPKDFVPVSPDFLVALAEASLVAAGSSVRVAMTRVQLRGRAGEVVATDGRQLLVQGGFRLPWKDDVLVPRLPALASRDMVKEGEARVGRTAKHVHLEVGPWAFALPIDAESKFPDHARVIPAAVGVKATLRLDPADGKFLASVLPKLPGAGDDNGPVTLDLCQPPAVRAVDADTGQKVEVALPRSTASGQPFRVYTARELLRKALLLGFTEFQVTNASSPLLCRDATRVYVWVPLDPKHAAAPGDGFERLSPLTGMNAHPKAETLTPPPRRETTMPPPQPSGNAPDHGGNGRDGQPAPVSLDALIAEGEELRNLLQEAAGRNARLLAALKRYKRQSRVLESAVESLRQLRLDR
jgi:hypothetical protein